MTKLGTHCENIRLENEKWLKFFLKLEESRRQWTKEQFSGTLQSQIHVK